jgi:hypothetical protein
MVAGDWLDRLARTRRARVGVVGTFTNAVGTATYPLPRADNALPTATTSQRSTRCSRSERGPGARAAGVHGPCLYFRRDASPRVGAFDGAPLGSDYGIEIDFCLRAGSAGFPSLLAGDVFVVHGPRVVSAGARRRARGALAAGAVEAVPDWLQQDARCASTIRRARSRAASTSRGSRCRRATSSCSCRTRGAAASGAT